MRIAVDGTGYASAAAVLVDANHVAALHYDALVARLAGTGAMAGSDTTSADFAESYDAATRQAIPALAGLVDAFAGLRRLTDASLANHRAAEATSVLRGDLVFDGGDFPRRDCLDVLPAEPPTALGGDSPMLPEKIAWILDHLQGVLFPDADVDRLRAAAAAWRVTAGGMESLVGYCTRAAGELEAERSPEVPLAVAALDELTSTIRELGARLDAIAGSCEHYADQVERTRALVLELAEELLREVVEGVIVSVALGVLTGGAATGASLSAVAARVASYSPRFAALLDDLRLVVSGLSSRVRVARDLLAESRVRLVKYHRAKVRDERGSLQLTRAGLQPGPAIEKLVRELPAGHSPPHRVVLTQEHLERLFRRLSDGGRELHTSYPGDLVVHSDGTRVGLRPSSTSGGATMDVFLSTGRHIKVHVS